MNVARRALSYLGGILLSALLIAALAPKATRAVVTLVQIVPAATTAYVVPTGYTLIVTDYEWATTSGAPGTVQEDWLINYNVVPVVTEFNLPSSTTIADKTGCACGHEHYAAGFRVASGTTLADASGSTGTGAFSFVKGYLVPND